MQVGTLESLEVPSFYMDPPSFLLVLARWATILILRSLGKCIHADVWIADVFLIARWSEGTL